MKTEPEVQTFYVVEREDHWDDASPLVMKTGTARKVLSGWKIITGREHYHYRTFIRNETTLDFDKTSAVARFHREAREALAEATGMVKAAKRQFNEIIDFMVTYEP